MFGAIGDWFDDRLADAAEFFEDAADYVEEKVVDAKEAVEDFIDGK